jgi:hypothetical protein
MPTQDLENELRGAFTRAAADFADQQQARRRLTERNYHLGSGHRRLAAGITAGVASAAVVLGLGLSGAFGPSAAHATRTIRTSTFTLTSYSDGTATLTLNPAELLNPTALQNDFQQYGIPAIVTSGSLCTSSPAPAGFSQAVTSPGPGTSEGTPGGNQPTITIDPSAIPAGTKLSVGDFQLTSGQYSGSQQADFVLVDTNSYTCSNTPPDPNGMPAGYGQDDGIGVLYGGPGPSSGS